MSAPGPWRDAAPASRVPYPPFPLPPPPPPPPPPPMADHGCAGAGRQTFCSAPIPGFYSPSLAQPAPGLPFARGAPAFPRPELPPSLMPGRKPTPSMSRSQSDDYFFQRESSTFPRHANTSPVPALPRKPDITQPPLPPKPLRSPPTSPPVLYGMAPGAPSYSGMDSSLVPSAPPPPPGMDHEDDVVLSRVLEMSAQESQRERELARQRQEALRAEQEQLAQALEASLRISSPPFAPEADGRSTTFITSSPEQGASSLPLHSPVLDISPNGPFDDHARRSSGNSNPHVAQQIMDDEALALQLAQEEERLAEQERRRETTGAHSRKPSQIGPGLGLADGPPQYDDAVSSPPVASPEFYNSSVSAHLSPNVAGPSRSPSPRLHLGRSISEKPVPPKSTTPEQRMSRSQSMGESAPSSSTALLAPGPPGGRPSSIVSSDWDPPDEPGRLIPSSPPPASDVPANTQYLDSELLAGLSMGFGTPSISPTLQPFAGVIPNVIALPYGRCPPFHIKAPSWRTLLKLMARLSGTRMEPTMEAMAVVKTEMKLRIVVSFVKVHHSSSEWHTVLYMTIDHPIPPNAPAGWRYRNGDTSTLPWSYSLSQMPAFLRDGADAALSKFYTIPCTPDTPFPTLPISFPNLATYLASALEHARDAMHDSSSGVRRLAKYVDQFYPSDRVGVLDDAPERAGMRQRLKNLVGIGSRPQRDRNAEMYELVTPFVPDDYGR